MLAVADVIWRTDQIVVTSWSQDSNALHSFNGHFVVLGADATDVEVGHAVEEALRVSVRRAVLRVPPLSREVPRADTMVPVYKAVGATSATRFVKGARIVGVGLHQGELTFQAAVPHRNGWTGAGEPLRVPAGVPVSAAELGRLCRERSDPAAPMPRLDPPDAPSAQGE